MAHLPKPESNAAKAAVARAQSLELPRSDRPESDDPEWPGSLADLSEDELGEQLTYWTAMTAYAGEHLAMADIERTAFERQRGAAWTKAFLRSTGDTVTERKALADNDPDVLNATQRHSIHDAQYKLLKALHEGYDKKYRAASRELTRRQNEYDHRRGE